MGKDCLYKYFLKVNRTKETSPSLIWGQSWGREGHIMLNTEFPGPLDLIGDTRQFKQLFFSQGSEYII